MLGGIIGAILMVSAYLLLANASGGPGGDKEAFERGKKNIHEFVEFVKGNEPDQKIFETESEENNK